MRVGVGEITDALAYHISPLNHSIQHLISLNTLKYIWMKVIEWLFSFTWNETAKPIQTIHTILHFTPIWQWRTSYLIQQSWDTIKYALFVQCTICIKINGTPKGVYLPISKLHSILAVANLFAHNKVTISYYEQVNSLRLKSNIASKCASKHLSGYHLFYCLYIVLINRFIPAT